MLFNNFEFFQIEILLRDKIMQRYSLFFIQIADSEL